MKEFLKLLGFIFVANAVTNDAEKVALTILIGVGFLLFFGGVIYMFVAGNLLVGFLAVVGVIPIIFAIVVLFLLFKLFMLLLRFIFRR